MTGSVIRSLLTMIKRDSCSMTVVKSSTRFRNRARTRLRQRRMTAINEVAVTGTEDALCVLQHAGVTHHRRPVNTSQSRGPPHGWRIYETKMVLIDITPPYTVKAHGEVVWTKIPARNESIEGSIYTSRFLSSTSFRPKMPCLILQSSDLVRIVLVVTCGVSVDLRSRISRAMDIRKWK